MNNCEKKLDALIDALGFDVEREVITPTNYVNSPHDHIPAGWRLNSSNSGEYIRSSSGCYQITTDSFSDYKLTKRKTTPVDVDIAKLVISWWEDEPWTILPENVTFNSRPDFVIKAYEVINEEI